LFGSLFDTYRTPLGSVLRDVPELPLISVEDRPGKRPKLVEFGAKRGDGLCPHGLDCLVLPFSCNSLPRSRMNCALLAIPFHTNSPRPSRCSGIGCSRGARCLAASSLCPRAECRRARPSAGAAGRALRWTASKIGSGRERAQAVPRGSEAAAQGRHEAIRMSGNPTIHPSAAVSRCSHFHPAMETSLASLRPRVFKYIRIFVACSKRID